MSPTDLYDEVAINFPAVWPQNPEWVWVNVHDGTAPKLSAIAALLEHDIGSSEVIVIVHSEPGVGAVMPKASAAHYIAGYVLQYEMQVSDPLFTCFVAVSRAGVATGWKAGSSKPASSQVSNGA
jgi:hypothetical protein